MLTQTEVGEDSTLGFSGVEPLSCGRSFVTMGFIKILSCITLVLITCNHGDAQRMKDKMYQTIDGASACYRLLNGTHQFGCASSRSGNVGIVHVIDNITDLDWLLNDGLAYPYVAVLRPSMFTMDVLTLLKNSSKVNGVLLLNNGSLDRPLTFSAEDSCPNRYSGLSSPQSQLCGSGQNNVWNPVGTSIMLVDWGFPIFYVTDQSDIEDILKCSQEHNWVEHPSDQLDRSLCALQLSSHMFAAVDSRRCMKRNSYYTLFSQVTFCDPLGGRNIWQTLFPRSTHQQETLSSDVTQESDKIKNELPLESNRSIAVLAARMDANSMFDGLVPGSIGAVTSVVTLIATSELLHRMRPTQDESDKNVLFLLLTGESYDYIGSSRVVYDMKHGTFPVRPDISVPQPPPIGLHHLGLFIELSQINKPENKQPLFVHRTQSSSQEIASAIKNLKHFGAEYNVSINSELPPSLNIPPSSLQTFLAADSDIPGLVLAGHPLQYTNPYYHSVYDDKTSLQYSFGNQSELSPDSIQMYLTNVSNTLALTLYEYVTGSPYSGTATADANLVDELLHCYLEQSNCSLFQSATAGNIVIPGPPLSLYVGVNSVGSTLTLFTGAVLAMLTGKHTEHSEAYCYNNASTDQVYQYIWVSSKWDDPNSTKVCVQTTMNFSSALSPAFIIDGYDLASGQYSSWTESIWPELTVRMFLKPSFRHEVLTLCLGIAVLVLSFCAVYFVKARKEILFNTGCEEESTPLIRSSTNSQVFC